MKNYLKNNKLKFFQKYILFLQAMKSTTNLDIKKIKYFDLKIN